MKMKTKMNSNRLPTVYYRRDLGADVAREVAKAAAE